MIKVFKKHQSVVYAFSILLLLSTWLASGYLYSDEKKVDELLEVPERSLLQKVRVRIPEIKKVSQEIVLNGKMEPARAVSLRTEVDGRVVSIAVKKGTKVSRGELIVKLDKRDRLSRLDEANAFLKQRKLEFAGSKKLQKNNLQSETQLARIAAQLESAKVLVKQIELEIDNTKLTAPFTGVLDQLPVEVGAYLQAGDEVARILEQNPIIFVGYVSQKDRHRLVLGDKGVVRLVTGQVVEGELRYIASEANTSTRTFRVELLVPNPDNSLISGITAELHIPVRFVAAFMLSPALLSLSETGQLGVKVVNDQDLVEFLPAQVIKSTTDGLWITGIPSGKRLITVGQGFVRVGEKVIAVNEQELMNTTKAK